MSWLHPLSVSGEQCAAAADGRKIFQQVAWCVRRMLIQDPIQHGGRLILNKLDLDAVEGQGLTLCLCLRDLLSAAEPHELHFVCVKFQSVWRHSSLQLFNAHCHTWNLCNTRWSWCMDEKLHVISIRVRGDSMTASDLNHICCIQQK